jgi:hypothetical protein
LTWSGSWANDVNRERCQTRRSKPGNY